MRLNAIVVSGVQSDIDRISDLMQQLDGDQGTRVTEIRVFPLHNADATELATVLNTAIKGQMTGIAGSTGSTGGGYGGNGGHEGVSGANGGSTIGGTSGGGNSGPGPALQTVLQFVTRSPDGQSVVSSQLQQGILITPGQAEPTRSSSPDARWRTWSCWRT